MGFHGKDVDQIIRDLVDVAINMTKKKIKEVNNMIRIALINKKGIIILIRMKPFSLSEVLSFQWFD